MSQRIKQEDFDNDGRWTTLPDIGQVRTGPRGQRYWSEYNNQPVRGWQWRPFEARFMDAFNRAYEERQGQYGHTENNPENLNSQGQSQSSFQRREPGEIVSTTVSPYIDPRRSKTKLPARIKKEQNETNTAPPDILGSRQASVVTAVTTRSEGLWSAPAHPAGTSTDASEDEPIFVNATRIERSPTPPRPESPGPELPALPTEGCVCPVNLDCDPRPCNLIDCRILVPKQQRWQRRQAEEPDPWAEIPDDDHETFATLAQIQEINDLLERLDNAQRRTVEIEQVLNKMRVWVVMMQVNSVREGELRQADVQQPLADFVSNANRPQRQQKDVPVDLVEDLRVISNKWAAGDYSVRPHRGQRRNERNRWVIDHLWGLYLDEQRGKFFGHGHLVNGQRFPDRMSMLVQGAHASKMGGIAGNTEEGAYSIVMGLHFPKQKLVYADVDCGEEIYYISTALKEEEGELESNVLDANDAALYVDPETATTGAKALMKSHETREPVRVFRSFRAAKIVPRRPQWGFRYDGLYRVEDYECLKQRRQIYRFRMKRLSQREDPDNGPLRGQPVARDPDDLQTHDVRGSITRDGGNGRTGGAGKGNKRRRLH